MSLGRYIPHDAQEEIHLADDYRFRIVCCGRRFGKTLCLAGEVLRHAHKSGGTYGWVAPTYAVAERGLEAIREMAGDIVAITGRAPTCVKIPTAFGETAKLWILSADNPDSIRGYGFNGIVLDEAASIDPNVWNYVLRPTIAQTLGWAVLIGTPHGRGYFFDLFTRGQDPEEKEYKSFHFPSIANEYFPLEEWEEAQRSLPSDVFKQEYEAEFIEDSAGVFHNVRECTLPVVPAKSAEIAIGCDLAKHTDHTVLISMDRKTGACHKMERFNNLDWPIQKERIVSYYRGDPGLVVMDATGIGDPVYDDLRMVIPQIEPVKLTNLSKAQLIQRLIVAIEQRQISWPKEWTVLTDELERYEYKITASGAITYNAPGGYHDDCVIALALANSARFQFKWTGEFKTFAPRQQFQRLATRTRTLCY